MQVLTISTKIDMNKENLFLTKHCYKSDDDCLYSNSKLHQKHFKDDQLIQGDSFLNKNYEPQLFLPYLKNLIDNYPYLKKNIK